MYPGIHSLIIFVQSRFQVILYPKLNIEFAVSWCCFVVPCM
jgi:hypothetical protein